MPDAPPNSPTLARRLGLFDATMLVMGGIVGSGIFMNPYVVARELHTPFLILAVWGAGGLMALIGAFIYAELAARRPHVGGQYAYIREAYHPSVAFVYGWGLLLVTQTGGMAAVAVTFARYYLEITGARIPDALVASLALGILTLINCLGVRAGSTVQSALMVLKILALVALIACGWWFAGSSAPPDAAAPLLDRPVSFDLLTAVGAAMVPVLFAYGGWQTSSFVAGEMRQPQRDLPRGLIIGVVGVVALYLAVNFVCVRVLGPAGLAATKTPASDVMRAALGGPGAKLIAAGIAISTLGFLSQGMLTAPRVYYAMAEDRLFFQRVGWLHPVTRVPVVAIALQGVWAIVIALSGRYEQILSYVVSLDFLFFGVTATCIFALRRRDAVGATFRSPSFEPSATASVAAGFSPAPSASASFLIPGHPFTTLAFVAASFLVVLNTFYKYWESSSIGLAILLSGVPAYIFWNWRKSR